MADCPSRFTLACLRAGDLSPDEAKRITAHAESCETCRAALAEIDANAAEYDSGAGDQLAQLMRRIADEPEDAAVVPLEPRRTSRVVKVTIALGGLAAAAMLALVLIPALTGDATPEQPGDVTFKGSLAVELVAKRQEDQFRVTEGAELRAGDAIRFVVSTGAPGWISVLSIDAAGRLSPFYPDTDPRRDPEPLRIDRAGRHELPGSIILDESRGHEEIVVVYSKNDFDRSRVHRAVADAESPAAVDEALGPDFAVSVVRINKGPP